MNELIKVEKNLVINKFVVNASDLQNFIERIKKMPKALN